MRILLTLAAKNNWPVYNFDFVAAYLNAPINEEVWVQAPEGLDVEAGEACLLKKALYGMKKAARCWWKHLRGTLADLGYISSYYDSSVYTLSNKVNRSIIWVHVDNGIVTGSSDEALKLLETQLKGSLEIKWEEGLSSMVGVKITRTEDGFELRQPCLISKILNEQWDGVSLASSPLPEGYSANSDDKEPGVNSTDYLSAIGSLSYVAVGTRPDITYSVNYLARFSARPSTIHWKGLRHLINYLAKSRDMPLKIQPSKICHSPVDCYIDANWGGPNSRSSYGVLIRLYGEMFTRKDIQYDLMSNILFSKAAKSTVRQLDNNPQWATNFCIASFLINIGRINTTVAFYPELRAYMRTYHPVPCLQKDEYCRTNLQDAPRIKTMLKSCQLPSEFNNKPKSLPDIAKRSALGYRPPTTVVNLIFELFGVEPYVSMKYFPEGFVLHDLFSPNTIPTKIRAYAFLWLMHHFLEDPSAITNFQHESKIEAFQIARLEDIQPDSSLGDSPENVDTPEEIKWGKDMQNYWREFLKKWRGT
ncbi:hypothetical protein PtA15_6A804 [Puccinia triticina]|uniref:Reverse transcriptase Ty1/copia-type domain-containing protein n=1 Tax=Puccinia triticina TaxID=208348 RepID=A0ABY7CTX8_9BASI|nr:uncharacterized protein PtA15_6A804 [Puccinia triticina]WAQ86172.1 hypothetical protein PtA15_6A804 [Puccinia triticina]WAR56059.1 hypothetical protein PtB15_6B803 [Puccinia triticina]